MRMEARTHALPLYAYSKLRNPRSDIRILVLRCRGRDDDDLVLLPQARHRNSNDAGSNKFAYEALSYTWDEDGLDAGSNDRTEASPGVMIPVGKDDEYFLKINGHRLPIRPNLAKAIARIRLPPCPLPCPHSCEHCSRRMWIDATCINQADAGERGAQIQFMSDIYHNATRCIIWLGEDDMYKVGERSFDFFVWIYRHMTSTTLTRQGVVDAVQTWAESTGIAYGFEDLERFLSWRYFRRLWVVQEIYSAQAITVFCGHHEISWHMFRWALMIYKYYGVKKNGKDLPAFALADISDVPLLLSTNQDKEPYGYTILDMMLILRNFECTDPRDRIGALSSMFGGTYEIDYRLPVEANYRSFALQLLKEGRIKEVLRWAAMLRTRLDVLSDPEFSMPSWIPDWRGPVPDPDWVFTAATNKSPVMSLGEVRMDTLRIKGTYFGQVTDSCTSIILENEPQSHLQWLQFELDTGAKMLTREKPFAHSRGLRPGDHVFKFGDDGVEGPLVLEQVVSDRLRLAGIASGGTIEHETVHRTGGVSRFRLVCEAWFVEGEEVRLGYSLPVPLGPIVQEWELDEAYQMRVASEVASKLKSLEREIEIV